MQKGHTYKIPSQGMKKMMPPDSRKKLMPEKDVPKIGMALVKMNMCKKGK